jgi:hypothetical protein
MSRRAKANNLDGKSKEDCTESNHGSLCARVEGQFGFLYFSNTCSKLISSCMVSTSPITLYNLLQLLPGAS